MFKWFKTLRRIVRTYDKQAEVQSREIDSLRRQLREIDFLRKEIAEAEKVIRDRTDMHLDISANRHDPNNIILIGRYNGMDYVQTYTIHDDDFSRLVTISRDMGKYANRRRVDAPPTLSAVFQHDNFRD